MSICLKKKWYVNNPICLCVFIKKSETRLTIIAVYVDDLKPYRNPWRAHKNNQLFKEWIWHERFGEKKKFFWPVDRALFKWHIGPTIDI